MSTKTSQLQIRVSPEEKAALKRLAADAGVSVSAFVLSQALPSSRRDFNRRVRGLAAPGGRHAALADLVAFLATLSPEEFPMAVAGADLGDLPVVVQNYAAAAVETEAHAKGAEPPSWVDTISLPDRPSFAWELRSLRPHLMRITPVAYKRRYVFVAAPGGRADAPAALARTSTGDIEHRLAELDRELMGTPVDAELCLVGGAQMPIVFARDPASRRPRALFAPRSVLTDAVGTVGERLALPAEWSSDAVRGLVEGSGRGRSRFYAGKGLRVLAPPPAYVLAMRCAELEFAPAPDEPALEADVHYLLRFLDVHSPDEGVHIVSGFLTERQRPSDLAARFRRLLPR